MTEQPKPGPLLASPLLAALARLTAFQPPAEYAGALAYPTLGDLAAALVVWRPPQFEPDDLIELAVAFRNSQPRAAGLLPAVRAETDGPTLDRWSANYLRHIQSPYDQMMTCSRWVVAAADADRLQALIAVTIGDRIARTYPHLYSAVQRQLGRRWGGVL